ncbi:MAG: phosphatase PAP2 family protein [Candidatus Thorarchaeota archaeon]
MSEKTKNLSKRALLIIGITSLAILVVGLILYFTGFNEAFYSSSSTVRSIFNALTYLGEPIVFLIITVILFLGYNKKSAKNLLLSLMFSYYLNEAIKSIFQDPRPATNLDAAEDYGVKESSYGFPSGHSQNSVAYWGYLGNEFKNTFKKNQIPIIPILLSVIIFLVAISRIIIGVHDLQDIIGGLLLGIGLLLVFIYLEPIFAKQFNKINLIAKIILVLVISIGLFLIGFFLYPETCVGVAVTPVPPYPDTGAYGLIGGVILGFGLGYLLECEYIGYNPSDLTNKKKIINVIIGIVIATIIFLPLEYLLKIDSVFYRFARYAIVAFVLSYVVPLICKKINK